MEVNDYKLVKFKDIADYFGLEVSEVRDVLEKYTRISENITRKMLWNLIITGAQQELGTIDSVAEKWETIRKSRYRTQITPAKRDRIIKRDKNRCRYCGKKVNKNNRVIDHIVPWSKGGRNNEENLVVACKECNSEKGDNLLENTSLRLLPIPNED
jgi:DNA-directed RNA polymerase subunit RPC12/RpoP